MPTAFWPITQEPKFCHIRNWWSDINNNISFDFRIFSRKINHKIFPKLKKKTILESYWAFFFCLNLDKNQFSWEKSLCQVLNIPIIYHHAKNQRKLPTHSWEKQRTDRRTDRQITVILQDPSSDEVPKKFFFVNFTHHIQWDINISSSFIAASVNLIQI